MFCPQCRTEYRPGFTHCTDCDVDLVAELPKKESPDSAERGMQVVWRIVLGIMAVSFFARFDIGKFIERHTSHEKLASVLYHGEWSLGEYRECISTNLKTEGNEPHFDCTDSLSSGVDKVFNVAFSGDLTVRRRETGEGHSPLAVPT